MKRFFVLAVLLLLLVSVLWPGTATATFTYVSSASAINTASGTTLTVDVASVAVGDIVVVGVGWEGGATTVTISDGASPSTWVALTQRTHTSVAQSTQGNYTLNSAKSGTVTYTATWSAARDYRHIAVHVYRPSATPVFDSGTDVTAEGTSASISTGNITTTGTDELVVAWSKEWIDNADSAWAINGLAAANPNERQWFAQWDKTFTSTFTGAGTRTAASSVEWVAGIAGFKIVAAAAAAPTLPLLGVGP